MWSLSTSDSGNVSTTLSLRYVSVIGLMVCIALCTLSHLTSASREVISYDIPAGQESTRASQLALVAKKDDSDTGPKFAMPKKRRLQPRAAIPLHEVNMLLVVTVDGTVSAVHKTTGEILWQQEHLGGNLVSTRILQEEEGQLEDVLDDKASSTNHATSNEKQKKQNDDNSSSSQESIDESLLSDKSTSSIHTKEDEREKQRKDSMNDVFYFPEPAGDGALYVYAAGRGLQKLPYSIRYLVSSPPFGALDGTAYATSQHSTLYVIDPRTGSLLKRYNIGGQDIRPDNPAIPSDAILLGRQDYTLTIFDSHQNAVKWNISYGEFTYTKPDSMIALPNTNTIHDISIEANEQGDIMTQHGDGYKVWQVQFDSPVVGVYEAMRTGELQGRMVLVKQDLSANNQARQINNKKTLISMLTQMIGKGKERRKSGINASAQIRLHEGNLFAMSTDHFPKPSSPLKTNSPECITESDIKDLNCLLGHHKIISPQDQPLVPSAVNGNHLYEQLPPGKVETALTNGDYWTSVVTTAWQQIRRSTNDEWYWWLFIISTGGLVTLSVIYYGKRVIMRYYTMYNGSTTTTTTTKTRAIESDGTPKGKQPRRRRRKQMQDDTNGQAMSERKSTKSTSNNEVTTKVVETIETMNDGDTQRTNSTTLTKTTSDMNGDITAVDTLVTTNTTSANTNNTTAIATRLRKDSNGNSVINSLTITNEILGHGSHGTIVFKGDFGGKKVAVKRQLLDYYDLVDHEVAILQESDDHPNVIRYYCRERCDRFLYIAFELCQTTLHEAVESAHRGQPSLLNHLSKAQLLYQIASGLYHLHSLKLVHRDLKPHNILVMSKVRSHSTTTDDHQAKNIEVRVLISDFGLSKRLEADQSSFGDATLRQGSGTVGWRAQELMRATDSELLINGSSSNDSSSSSHDGRTKRRVIKAYTNMSTTETPDDNPTEMPTTKPRVTKAIDVFAAGCVFYHALTGGDHPFGDRYERESNILKNNYDLSGLSMDNVAEAEARDLISAMIQYQPEHRPTIGQVLLHPFFWSNEKRLAFLQDASDRFEAEPRDIAASPLLQKLEANSISVVGLDWSKRLDKSMLSQLGKFRRYDVQSVRDLLRAIRNKKHHFQDLPETERKLLGSIPDGFLTYYSTRFPILLIYVYHILLQDPTTLEDPIFQSYFTGSPTHHTHPPLAH